MRDKELSQACAELDAIQREAWEADLELRKQAETDPALAAILADADAQYEAKHGIPWRNPLLGNQARQKADKYEAEIVHIRKAHDLP